MTIPSDSKIMAVEPAEAITIVLEEVDAPVAETGAGPGNAGLPGASIGDVLGNRYQLLELIGEGGMSRVYRALDSQTPATAPESYLALKLFSRPFDGDADAFSALRAEITRLSRLNHPNIVRIHGCDREGPAVFVTMELLSGPSLYMRMQSGRLRDGVSIVKEVADALDHAHQHDVVHGDLKPGNVILPTTGGSKVIDFSIAGLIARPKTPLERREAVQSRGALAVTPRYASPQLMLRHAPVPADDVYALACLAYEVLTGVHPFDLGTGAQALSLPPAMKPGLTSSQYDAIVNGLRFERQHRTATVRQFITEFETPVRAAAETGRSKGVLLVLLAALAIVAGWRYFHAPTQSTSVIAQIETIPASGTSPVAVPERSKSQVLLQDCATCGSMRVVPPGSFSQGAAAGETGASKVEMPQHVVSLAAPLAVSTNDITVGEFDEFVAETGRKMEGCEIYDGAWRLDPKASYKNPGFEQGQKHPATCVSWNDAVAYANWLSAKNGHAYRLPSASEWEYAARAGIEFSRPWDSNESGACALANVADQSAAERYPGWHVFSCDDGYVNTAPVGSFRANAFGLNDMLGNVFQWTQDCWQPDYAQAPVDGSARTDGDCNEHELRGGSWFSTPKFVSVSRRNRFPSDFRTSSVGFRLVRMVEP